MLWSYHLWSHFDLTTDFATFTQAFQQIGTGHLDPRLTTFPYDYPNYGYPFWQSHLELVLWPLSLLYPLGHSSFELLVVQDLALAASGLVALRWGLDLLARGWPHRGWSGPAIGTVLLAVLVLNPWVYWTASFDFHVQPIATLCILLAGRDIWNGRRRALWWVAATLLCGDVATTYVLALGISALLASKATRRWGVGLVATSLVWFAVVLLVGSGKGSTLSSSYGYLAQGTVSGGLIGLLAIAAGTLTHPAAPLRTVHERLGEILKYPAAMGYVGVVSAIGLPMTAIVLGANALTASPVFVGSVASFQSLVVVLFLAVGLVEVCTWLAGGGRLGLAVAGVAVTGVLVVALGTSLFWIPKVRSISTVSTSAASTLDRTLAATPADAEVVAANGVIGRFGGRQHVYPLLTIDRGQTVPVEAAQVVFVFTDAGTELTSPGRNAADQRYVATTLHATELAEGGGVTTYLWRPPASARSITLPTAP